MISGFESITQPLTVAETQLLPVIIAGLRTKIGADKAISNEKAVGILRTKGYQITEARFRKLVNHIRVNNLVPCLVASSKGYYIAETQDDLIRFLKSLKERMSAIQQVHDAIAEQMEAKYQTELFENDSIKTYGR